MSARLAFRSVTLAVSQTITSTLSHRFLSALSLHISTEDLAQMEADLLLRTRGTVHDRARSQREHHKTRTRSTNPLLTKSLHYSPTAACSQALPLLIAGSARSSPKLRPENTFPVPSTSILSPMSSTRFEPVLTAVSSTQRHS